VSIDHLLQDLAIDVEPFATCIVSSGWRLRVPETAGATLHFVLQGTGELRLRRQDPRPLAPFTLAVVPDQRAHVLQVPPTPLREARADLEATGRLAEHVAGVDGDRELLVICGRVQVRYGGATPLFALLEEPIVVDFTGSAAVRSAFAHLLEESRTPQLGQVTMLRALMAQCLVALLRHLHDTRREDAGWLAAVADPRIAKAVAAVLDDPGAPHTVDSLAARASLSRSAFASRFRTMLGRPPMDFVRHVRMHRAATLLRTTDLDTATVAHRVGFASRSHFSQTFLATVGASPSAYRRA
jgi:AraC-like DNA-binding protein